MGTVGGRGTLTELDIRIFIRDNEPSLNVLLDDYEFTKDEIDQALTLAVDRWNEHPPVIDNYTVETFPFRHYLLKGVCANLLTMAAMRYRRNALTTQIPGGAVDPDNKADSYDASAARLSAEYGQWIDRMKAQINMAQCWGSL